MEQTIIRRKKVYTFFVETVVGMFITIMVFSMIFYIFGNTQFSSQISGIITRTIISFLCTIHNFLFLFSRSREELISKKWFRAEVVLGIVVLCMADNLRLGIEMGIIENFGTTSSIILALITGVILWLSIFLLPLVFHRMEFDKQGV